MAPMGGGKDQGGGPAYEPGVDLRLDFIFEYLQRSMKVKLDKWMKMMMTEEYKAMIMEFLDNPDVPVIIRNYY
jgi:hypothetical protein